MFTLTAAQKAQLLENGRKAFSGDHVPVVELFVAAGAHTWLLSALDPDDPDIAWCIADIGYGYVEAGTVSLFELQSIRVGLIEVEVDRHFDPKGHRLYEFYRAAQPHQSLIAGIRDVLAGPASDGSSDGGGESDA
jgi:hypothetical protein